MSDEIEIEAGTETPIWAAFGDLMSVLLGAFVLILVGVIGMQLQLSHKLDEAVRQQHAEAQRRISLEHALAVPLAAGRITLVHGRIGIRGNVLFALNSDQLQPAGRELLQSLAQPLSRYLQSRNDPDGERLHRRPAGARRQPPLRRQLGAFGRTRADGHPRADCRRRARRLAVCGRIRLAGARQFQRQRHGPRQEPTRGNRPDSEAIGLWP